MFLCRKERCLCKTHILLLRPEGLLCLAHTQRILQFRKATGLCSINIEISREISPCLKLKLLFLWRIVYLLCRAFLIKIAKETIVNKAIAENRGHIVNPLFVLLCYKVIYKVQAYSIMFILVILRNVLLSADVFCDDVFKVLVLALPGTVLIVLVYFLVLKV